MNGEQPPPEEAAAERGDDHASPPSAGSGRLRPWQWGLIGAGVVGAVLLVGATMLDIDAVVAEIMATNPPLLVTALGAVTLTILA